jgi:hypothetical protein
MHSKEQITVVHPASLRPEDFLRFVEIDPFPRLWSELKLGDESLQALQVGIMASPSAYPVVPGAGGLRKLRFSKPGSDSGKRGSFRVYYTYFEEYGIVLLLAIIAKNGHDLTRGDLNALAMVVDRAKKLLEKGVIR